MSESPTTGAAVAGRFYRRQDWVAGGIVAALTLTGYLWTLAPSVTLEDSGELVTAAYHLGVPHPPGYPIWTVLAWLWCHLIPFGNIAWRGNLLSAVCSAVASGLAALLVSKSGYVLAQKVGFLRVGASPQLLDRIVLVSSIAAGLLLAFCPVMWSQAVITEVYGLNASCWMATLVVLYRWSFEPEKRWRLYLAAFIWGVGLTAHQTLVLLAVAFPTFIWFTDRKLGRAVLMPILTVIITVIVVWVFQAGSLFHQGTFPAVVLLGVAAGAGFWLYRLAREGPGWMGRWPQVVLLYGAVILGLCWYGYLFVSACTNPPMNWGHCSQWESFQHHFTRGQYEKLHVDRSVLQCWGQLNMFFDDLQGQFNLLYALLALLALFFFRDLDDRDRNWLKFLFIAFLCLGLGFIFLSNPSLDRQKQFTDRVFFLPCHCLYVLWIGYGLILGMGYLFTERPSLQRAAGVFAVGVILLPVSSWWRNWADEEQRGHDFGYRFGYRMLKPGGDYPEMERDAILFGGTDPGRFVATYLIFVESFAPPGAKTRLANYPDSGTFDRRDVYIITQNALADRTYMAYIRDQYDPQRPRRDDPSTVTNRSGFYRALFGAFGRDATYPRQPIWIPSERDSQQAFARYVEDLKTRPPLPGETVSVENGRVSVQGLAGVMAINGYLSQDIFEHNKDQHAFYVEESYLIPWMESYLEPYGIILKINPHPLPSLTPAMLARDTAYWDALVADLLGDPKFRRDDVAQKTYSQLRAAIGSLYASRHLYREAEHAFTQAVDLCPASPEASFRLAQLYIEQHQFDAAVNVLGKYRQRDPYNTKIPEALDQVNRMRDDLAATAALEQQLKADPGNLPVATKLARAYALAQRFDDFDNLINRLIAAPDLAPTEHLTLISFYAQLNRPERVQLLLGDFTRRHPQNALGWYNFAAVLSSRGNCLDGMSALTRALQLDGPDRQIHLAASQDKRFATCRRLPQFQQLIGGGSPVTGSLPFKLNQ